MARDASGVLDFKNPLGWNLVAQAPGVDGLDGYVELAGNLGAPAAMFENFRYSSHIRIYAYCRGKRNREYATRRVNFAKEESVALQRWLGGTLGVGGVSWKLTKGLSSHASGQNTTARLTLRER